MKRFISANSVIRKPLFWRSEFTGKQVWLQFDGAMADAKVYLNGKLLTGHRDGYTRHEVQLHRICCRVKTRSLW